ncbi:polyphenol oxidase family protein [Desulfovibrio sp. OttesenSCG-928-G15]|nr:polyphenol oxidase family protein [Desulfovibrio sp. OttesenSCG-928-G15]
MPDAPHADGAFISFAFPGVSGVRCVFTTATRGTYGMGYGDAGNSPENTGLAAANRQALLASCGLSRWVELRQVHKDHIVFNPEPTGVNENSRLEGDGASTKDRGLALAIKTADCQPILLTDKAGSAVAALHAGWRGNAMNFPGTGVARFCEEYGIAPKDVLAVRGPSLGPAAAEFVNFVREWPEEFTPWFCPPNRTMDLWGLCRAQLVAAGLEPGNVFSLDLCTFSLPGLFFSHRRGDAGRQVSLIWKE